MPVIPALSEAKAGGSLEVRSSRPVWTTWESPFLLKIIIIIITTTTQELVRHGDTHL